MWPEVPIGEECARCLRPKSEDCSIGYCETHCKELLNQGSLHEI